MVRMSSAARGKSAIAVDFGQHGVRAVQLHRSRSGWEIAGLARAQAKFGVSSGLSSNDQQLDQLRSCLSQAAFAGRDAVVALQSPDVEYHSLDIPGTCRTSGAGSGRVGTGRDSAPHDP
jgi:Tfp pilus assembly PilM family ATPase